MGFRDRGYGGSDGGYGGGRSGGSSGGRPSYNDGGMGREVPVKQGEEYDLEITDVAKKGDGIGKVEGFIIFVAGAHKGDKLRVRISQVRNRFAIGEVVGSGASTGAASTTEESEVPAGASEGDADEQTQ
ncbi:MAG: TRAM domain-containing protein [Candidatus Micrarchaeota archaeon]